MIRIIKRYPNRRLYDTVESRYVSLEDLRKLVLSATAFKVIDSKTSEECTRPVLLQILLDQESQATPLLSDALIRSFICADSHPVNKNLIAPFLELSLEAFQENYEKWNNQVGIESDMNAPWQNWWQQPYQNWMQTIENSSSAQSEVWNSRNNWLSSLNEFQSKNANGSENVSKKAEKNK